MTEGLILTEPQATKIVVALILALAILAVLAIYEMDQAP